MATSPLATTTTARAAATTPRDDKAWIQTVVATLVDLCVGEKLTEAFGGGSPVEGFAWSVVEFVDNPFQIFPRQGAQIGAFRKVLTQEWSGPRKVPI